MLILVITAAMLIAIFGLDFCDSRAAKRSAEAATSPDTSGTP